MKCEGSVSCSVVSDSLALQAPLSMEVSRQEYLSGLPSPPPGDLYDPGIKPGSPHCGQILYCVSYQRLVSTSFRFLSNVPSSGFLIRFPLKKGFESSIHLCTAAGSTFSLRCEENKAQSV